MVGKQTKGSSWVRIWNFSLRTQVFFILLCYLLSYMHNFTGFLFGIQVWQGIKSKTKLLVNAWGDWKDSRRNRGCHKSDQPYNTLNQLCLCDGWLLADTSNCLLTNVILCTHCKSLIAKIDMVTNILSFYLVKNHALRIFSQILTGSHITDSEIFVREHFKT